MKKVYVAIVQYPMAPLDCTYVEVFRDWDSAQAWVDETIADPDARNGYSADEMNWDINERDLTGL